jgi:hypothetical protein
MVSTGCLAIITSLIGYTAVGIESRCLLATVSRLQICMLEFLNNLWGARNRVGTGLSYRPASLHSLVEYWFLGIDSWAP